MERTHFPSANFPLPIPGRRPTKPSKLATKPAASASATVAPHDLVPVDWDRYWDARLDTAVEGRGTFRVYSAGHSGPVLLCLHGGGYSGLTWSLLAARLKDSLRIIAPDLRGHGDTATPDDGALSAQDLARDVAALWAALIPHLAAGGSGSGSGGGVAEAQERAEVGAGAPPPLVLVGHSMGGAIAVHAAANERLPGLGGLVVIDVVEGTALASLPHMAGVLAARPRGFGSREEAIRWALRSGMCQSSEAACVSVPGMLTQRSSADGDGGGGATASDEGLPGISEEVEPGAHDGITDADVSVSMRPSQHTAMASSSGHPQWVWRAALRDSERYWEGWYRGLSDAFLRVPVPKALVLAGTDRLDKTLTIGQMQGRFQLVLLPQAGHAVHEDEADKVADTLRQFVTRFRIGQPLRLPSAKPGETFIGTAGRSSAPVV